MPKQMKDFHSNKDGLGKIASKRVNFLRTEGEGSISRMGVGSLPFVFTDSKSNSMN